MEVPEEELMRRSLAGIGVVAAIAALAGPATADSRVSFELGGLYSFSPVDDGSAMGTSRQINTAMGSTATPTVLRMPSDGLYGVDFRPVFSLAGGMRISIGFRAGSGTGNGSVEEGGTTSRMTNVSLVGGDVSLGYGRFFGKLLPYGEVRAGFNSYDLTAENSQRYRVEQLRVDGVLGARLYLSDAFYVSAAAFGGFGDRYGAQLGLGFDILHYRHRGAMP